MVKKAKSKSKVQETVSPFDCFFALDFMGTGFVQATPGFRDALKVGISSFPGYAGKIEPAIAMEIFNQTVAIAQYWDATSFLALADSKVSGRKGNSVPASELFALPFTAMLPEHVTDAVREAREMTIRRIIEVKDDEVLIEALARKLVPKSFNWLTVDPIFHRLKDRHALILTTSRARDEKKTFAEYFFGNQDKRPQIELFSEIKAHTNLLLTAEAFRIRSMRRASSKLFKIEGGRVVAVLPRGLFNELITEFPSIKTYNNFRSNYLPVLKEKVESGDGLNRQSIEWLAWYVHMANRLVEVALNMTKRRLSRER